MREKRREEREVCLLRAFVRSRVYFIYIRLCVDINRSSLQ